MSGQWEVVGRKKGKDVVPNKKITKENKKSSIPYTPKIEDVLSFQQVKNLYSKDIKKPQEKEKHKNDNGKKVQKKETTQEAPKPKPPKTIESALNSIDIEEFKSILESNKLKFPDAPIIWLKQLAQFLNLRVPVEIQDCTFYSRPETYPFSVIPSPLRAVMEQSLKEAGDNNAQLFFDISLTAMANDMSKNLSSLGHKFFIQCLALNYPKLVLQNLDKYTSLRISYQNRQNIGLSILWAVGQVGVKDLSNGLKVFQEIFLPVVEMKSYSRYVIQYLIALIKRHQKASLNVEQYLLILDVAFANYKNFPSDLKSNLLKAVESLDIMLLSNFKSDKYHVLIEPLLIKLQSNDNAIYKKQICDVLVVCLSKDKSAFEFWSKCYTSCVAPSTTLLQYIDSNWATLSSKFKNSAFNNLLNSYSITNEELKVKRKKEPSLAGSIAIIEKLKEKMTTKRDYNFLCDLVIALSVLAICFAVYTDIQESGSWQGSKTRYALRVSGVLKVYWLAIGCMQDGLIWLNSTVEQQFPGFYEAYLEAYVKLIQDYYLITLNICGNLKHPTINFAPVGDYIESYAPGLIEGSQKVVINSWDGIKYYIYHGLDYLKNDVFVGQLAPENIQKVVYEAFNTTQQKAFDCYHWLYEKVQSAIK